MLGKELLRESQRDRRGDPADFHHGHEASSDCGSDLVESPRPGNDGHGGEVDGVLDWGDLEGKDISH